MRLSIWPGTEHPWHEILATAQHAQASGWDGVWLADHFMDNAADGSRPLGPRLEAWSVLAGVAAAVERLRLGVLVSSVTYRHPAVLAKIATTVDEISGGRLVLGLGAGWQHNEHEAYGIDLGTIRERLARLDEACEVITRLLRAERSDFAGSWFRLNNAVCEPKAASGGLGLPLVIGGGGERVTMRIAARHSDGWNTWGFADKIVAKTEVLHRHCDELGRDPATIERSAQVILRVREQASPADDVRQNRDLPVATGSAGQLAEVVEEFVSIGLDELIVPDRALGSTLAERLDVMDVIREQIAPRRTAAK